MEPLRQALIAKIKTLNETVWERRATEPAIEDWLNNFAHSSSTSSHEEQLHALFLLSNFMYFGSRQIRELLKAVYRDLYRYPIVESIRRAHADTLDSFIIDPEFRAQRNATRFIGVGNPSESGCHLLYYFRQENSLPKDLFIHTHQVFTRVGGGSLQLRNSAVTRYIFIDDFCGSGEQGAEYSRDLVEDIKKLNPNAVVAYYVLFATAQGMNRLRSKLALMMSEPFMSSMRRSSVSRPSPVIFVRENQRSTQVFANKCVGSTERNWLAALTH